MHMRPDAVIKTGVIEPYWIRQVSPVDVARHTIDPFIASVRGPGPAVSPYPSPEDMAYAAGRIAKRFARGQSALVAIGTDKVTMQPGMRCGGIVGAIAQAANELARGGTVAIEVGGRRVIVCNDGPGGEPVVRHPPADYGWTHHYRGGWSANPMPTWPTAQACSCPQTVTSPPIMAPMPSPAADQGMATQVTVRETPMPAKSGLGLPAGQYMDFLRPTGPGRIYNAYRIETDDAPYRATMFNSIGVFAPQAAMETHDADRSALYLQRTEPAPAYASRPPMPVPYYNHAEPGQPFRPQGKRRSVAQGKPMHPMRPSGPTRPRVAAPGSSAVSVRPTPMSVQTMTRTPHC